MRMIALVLLLAGCSSNPTVVKERVETVSVPVIQKCASEKPPQVAPIDSRYSVEQWEALSHKQRAEIVAAQALARMNHADALAAATSAC